MPPLSLPCSPPLPFMLFLTLSPTAYSPPLSSSTPMLSFSYLLTNQPSFLPSSLPPSFLLLNLLSPSFLLYSLLLTCLLACLKKNFFFFYLILYIFYSCCLCSAYF